MATKDCKGCGANFDISTREGRVDFSHHINGCIEYQNQRAEAIALKNKDAQENKDDSFLNMLDDSFTEDQKRSLLEAVAFYTGV